MSDLLPLVNPSTDVLTIIVRSIYGTHEIVLVSLVRCNMDLAIADAICITLSDVTTVDVADLEVAA